MDLRRSTSKNKIEKIKRQNKTAPNIYSNFNSDLSIKPSNSNLSLKKYSYSLRANDEKFFQKNENLENKEDKTEENKKKNLKRRTKKDSEGRNFECKICQKTYLSYPALYTHTKIKHNKNNNSSRGRGRPKKEQNENDLEKKKYNPTNFTFFSKEERTGRTDPRTEINNCIDKAFIELYSKENKKRNELRNMKSNIKLEEHPFLYKFKQDCHDIYRNVINEFQIIDIVLIDYLNKMSMFCNPDYYIKLIKFVTLFREHANKFNKNKDNKNNLDNKEYTEINDAEDLPDSANEFINVFLNPEEKEADFGFTMDESVDLTLNLCYWMYENNYTCSKLILNNNV